MATNIGTLVGAAIRPIDSNDTISTAWDNEIKGGHHSYKTMVERDLIIIQRRSWGMLCTVYDDSPSKNGVYQLKWNYSSSNIMDNNNWVIFSSGGSGGSGGSKYWLDPVLSVSISEPLTPNDGDSYIAGLNSTVSLTGSNWSLKVGGLITKWNSTLSKWDDITPLNGYSVRVQDDDDSIYRYEGTYSTGQWYKERVNQVFSFGASSSNGNNYFSEIPNLFTYSTSHIYLTKFLGTNSGTSSVTLNINGLGNVLIRKQTSASASSYLMPRDLVPDKVYSVFYDGEYFKFSKSLSDSLFDVKWKIQSEDVIQVPAYSEYLVYGDLELNGVLDVEENGKVVIINGQLINNGGILNNRGTVESVYFRIYDVNENGPATYKRTFTASFVAGVTQSFNHDLHSNSVLINTWDDITGEQIIMNVKRVDIDNIEIQSLSNLDNVRVVILG